ncbi:MAG: hypothetical protein O7E52_14260 [Candidatus Poribacteria bacterium]|nr:hypothetical protein [Candidatus Poribacteria bacterium]
MRATTDSHLVFDELRTPHALFTDDEPVDPDMPGNVEHRELFVRYKARSRHLAEVRQERTAVLFEAMALWDDTDYAARLGELLNQFAPLEQAVLDEATSYVGSMIPSIGDSPTIDRNVLFAPLDTSVLDEPNAKYQAIKDEILQHLRPKIRCPFMTPIENHQLVFHEQGLCDHGAGATRAHEFCDGGYQMD